MCMRYSSFFWCICISYIRTDRIFIIVIQFNVKMVTAAKQNEPKNVSPNRGEIQRYYIFLPRFILCVCVCCPFCSYYFCLFSSPFLTGMRWNICDSMGITRNCWVHKLTHIYRNRCNIYRSIRNWLWSLANIQMYPC